MCKQSSARPGGSFQPRRRSAECSKVLVARRASRRFAGARGSRRRWTTRCRQESKPRLDQAVKSASFATLDIPPASRRPGRLLRASSAPIVSLGEWRGRSIPDVRLTNHRKAGLRREWPDLCFRSVSCLPESGTLIIPRLSPLKFCLSGYSAIARRV